MILIVNKDIYFNSCKKTKKTKKINYILIAIVGIVLSSLFLIILSMLMSDNLGIIIFLYAIFVNPTAISLIVWHVYKKIQNEKEKRNEASNNVNVKLDCIDKRLYMTEQLLQNIKKIDYIDKRLEDVNVKLGRINGRIDNLEIVMQDSATIDCIDNKLDNINNIIQKNEVLISINKKLDNIECISQDDKIKNQHPNIEHKVFEPQYELPKKDISTLTDEEKSILSCISEKPIHIDTIVDLCKLPIDVVSTALTMLEIEGFIVSNQGGTVSVS